MKYEVKVPALAGDTFPLALVAEAMAHRDASAGGPDILRATLEGCRTRYQAMLLKNVRNGTLTVCDDDGDPGNAADIVARRTAEGCGVVVLLPGLDEIDVDATWLCNVFVKLRRLNEWANDRGDEFTISHDGVQWIESSHHISEDGNSHFQVRHQCVRIPPQSDLVQPAAAPLLERVVETSQDLNSRVGSSDQLKKTALVEKHRHHWPTIELDLRRGSENGLSAEASAGRHGWWNEGAALEWARQRGKLKAIDATAALVSSRIHRIR